MTQGTDDEIYEGYFRYFLLTMSNRKNWIMRDFAVLLKFVSCIPSKSLDFATSRGHFSCWKDECASCSFSH